MLFQSSWFMEWNSLAEKNEISESTKVSMYSKVLMAERIVSSFQNTLSWRCSALKSWHHQHILSLLEKQPDITCLEIIETLNLSVSIDTVWRFLQKAGYRRKKKSLHASERKRPRCGREEEKLERSYIWVQCK